MHASKFFCAAALLLVTPVAIADCPHALEKGWCSPVGKELKSGSVGNLRLGWHGLNSKYPGFFHLGQDIKGTNTDPLYAIGDCIVSEARTNVGDYGGVGKSGGAIVMSCATTDGEIFDVLYGHVQNIKLKKGDRVSRGDQIAEIGPYVGGVVHLHFGIRRFGYVKHSGDSKCSMWAGYGDPQWKDPDCGFTDPIAFLNSHRPATLIAKGEESVYHVAGYVLTGSDLCTSATHVHKIVEGGDDDSSYWVTKEVDKDDACRNITSTLTKGIEDSRAQGGTVKASGFAGARSAIASWLSKTASAVFHWIFGEEARAASIVAQDPSIQRRLATPYRARVLQIAGTDKRIVALVDGPGMRGDRAIDPTPYADAPSGSGGPYDPKRGDNKSGKRPDFIIRDLWTERGNGYTHDVIPWGDTVCLAALVKNEGNADAPDEVKVDFFLSKGVKEDRNPKKVGRENIRAKNLEKGEKKTERHCLDRRDDDYPSYPGPFNFGAHVDPENRIGESNEKNNYKGGREFTLSEHPQFSIVSLRLSQTMPIPGSEATAYLQVTNTGTPFRSGKVNIQYRIAGPQYGAHPSLIGFDQIKRENLRGGDVKLETITFVLPTTPGTYTLTAEVDHDQRTSQSDRSGSVGMLTFMISE